MDNIPIENTKDPLGENDYFCVTYSSDGQISFNLEKEINVGNWEEFCNNLEKLSKKLSGISRKELKDKIEKWANYCYRQQR